MQSCTQFLQAGHQGPAALGHKSWSYFRDCMAKACSDPRGISGMAVARSIVFGEFSLRAIFGSASRVEDAGRFEDLASTDERCFDVGCHRRRGARRSASPIVLYRATANTSMVPSRKSVPGTNCKRSAHRYPHVTPKSVPMALIYGCCYRIRSGSILRLSTLLRRIADADAAASITRARVW
jgi:hypothetical protein